MLLSDRRIKSLKPGKKKQTLADGRGLSFVVAPIFRGSTRYFVYNYRYHGKAQSLRLWEAHGIQIGFQADLE
ncbi:Arm DNA-binding domain-containing protein [Eikenella sp. NML96-A-049]|uniref:Arm DNA-binding domain-containing protein n=1 Tax=unclassified Eikenella TaxID=2639367 RepID=UPI0035107390